MPVFKKEASWPENTTSRSSAGSSSSTISELSVNQDTGHVRPSASQQSFRSSSSSDSTITASDITSMERNPEFVQINKIQNPDPEEVEAPQLPPPSSGIGTFTSSQLAPPSSSQTDFEVTYPMLQAVVQQGGIQLELAGSIQSPSSDIVSSQSLTLTTELPTVSACMAGIPDEELEPAGGQPIQPSSAVNSSQETVQSSPPEFPGYIDFRVWVISCDSEDGYENTRIPLIDSYETLQIYFENNLRFMKAYNYSESNIVMIRRDGETGDERTAWRPLESYRYPSFEMTSDYSLIPVRIDSIDAIEAIGRPEKVTKSMKPPLFVNAMKILRNHHEGWVLHVHMEPIFP